MYSKPKICSAHPELKKSVKAFIEALDTKTADGMQLEEIDKELEFVICNPKKKQTPNALLEKLHAVLGESDYCFQ